MSSALWEQCLSHLENNLTAQQLNTWLFPLQAIESADTLTLLAPNTYVKAWVSEQLEAEITTLITRLSHGNIARLKIDVGQQPAINPPQASEKTSEKTPTTSTNHQATSTSAKASPELGSPMNPLFTFDTFVEGKSNQIARASSLHVAEAPGTSGYNPLFLYGGTGLGKTHLMLAIGNKIKKDNPNAKVVYMSAERYVQHMVNSIRNNTIGEFKLYYRHIDALLIDDIQFFSKKERSQEEFFYTFNNLLDTQRQIILTCDRFPKEVDDLDERLKSRLSWGLTVDIEPPELETRVAILMKKAHLSGNGLQLNEEVAFFIAKRIRSNVRELEGALQRVFAYARFTRDSLSIELVQSALKDLLASHQKLITLDSIQKTVAEYYKIRVADLLSKKRTRSIARPRQIAMALAKELTNHSLPEIGDAFGGRDHTTVIHACRKVEELIETDTRIEEDHRNLRRTLSS